jgi:hypothetical protein
MTTDASRSEPKHRHVFAGRIDRRAGTATFQVEDGAIDLPDVHEGDNVRWDFSGIPAGWQVRIRFVRFPERSEPARLERGNTLEGAGGKVNGGRVQPTAADGPYAYVLELVDGQGSVTKLDVLIQVGESITRAAEGTLTKEFLSETGGVEGGNPGGP